MSLPLKLKNNVKRETTLVAISLLLPFSTKVYGEQISWHRSAGYLPIGAWTDWVPSFDRRTGSLQSVDINIRNIVNPGYDVTVVGIYPTTIDARVQQNISILLNPSIDSLTQFTCYQVFTNHNPFHFLVQQWSEVTETQWSTSSNLEPFLGFGSVFGVRVSILSDSYLHVATQNQSVNAIDNSTTSYHIDITYHYTPRMIAIVTPEIDGSLRAGTVPEPATFIYVLGAFLGLLKYNIVLRTA